MASVLKELNIFFTVDFNVINYLIPFHVFVVTFYLFQRGFMISFGLTCFIDHLIPKISKFNIKTFFFFHIAFNYSIYRKVYPLSKLDVLFPC